MTVSVNAVQPSNTGDLDAILKAVGIAVGAYGQKLDRDQAKELADLSDKRARELAQTTDTRAREMQQTALDEKEQTRALNFAEKFELVPKGAKGAVPGEAIAGILPKGFQLPPEMSVRPRAMTSEDSKYQFLASQNAADRANELAKLQMKGMTDGIASSKAVQKENMDIASRYNILKTNANDLKTLIKQYGTYEMFGPQQAQMESKLYQMAIDYAKLVDPSSVAREGEVAAAQKYMLPITGLTTSNDTAQKTIDAYVGDLEKRMAARGSAIENATGSMIGSQNFQTDLQKAMAELERRQAASRTAGK